MSAVREKPRRKLAALAAGLLTFAGVAGAASVAQVRDGPGLTAFRSDAELRRFLRRLRDGDEDTGYAMAVPPPPAVAAPMEAAGSDDEVQAVVVTGAAAPQPGITNTQEAGVDEGGIVKVRGDTLVILRRGRLFTVSTAGGRMRPIDSINAYPPGVSAEGDWYDEMLLSGDRVIVVGYSYGRGGTEVNRFRLDPAGRLRWEDAYHLRSNDYYSSRNYASRLIGDQLILYAPLELDWDKDPLEALPGIRRWTGDEKAAFRPITSARRVFIPPAMRRAENAEISALHTVTRCDLAAPVLDCQATAVFGPEGRTFYVSSNAVYLWLSEWRYDSENDPSLLYRLPLDGSRPSAVGVRGAPADQFSFKADPQDGVLNVLVRSEGGGDAMFRPEFTEGSVALLRLPTREFGDGSREAPRALYRPLPAPPEDAYDFHNRFVGSHVLYGVGEWENDERAVQRWPLIAARVRGGPAARLPLPHGVDRIEVLGRDALVVGSAEDDLNFTAVELEGPPRVADRHVLPAASEGESRSHAFFYSPRTADGRSGILGLPISREAPPAYRRFFGSSAAMLFLQRDNRRFSPAGELAARVEGVADDGCQASCVDWYGNARPIFLGDRIFALLGYELVEGEMRGDAVREVGRVNFAPSSRAARAPS